MVAGGRVGMQLAPVYDPSLIIGGSDRFSDSTVEILCRVCRWHETDLCTLTKRVFEYGVRMIAFLIQGRRMIARRRNEGNPVQDKSVQVLGGAR